MGKNADSVSVVIAVYNEEERIKGVLEVLSKKKLAREVIVVNDGSTDNTLKVVRKFRNIKVINYNKNRGQDYALMKGINSARGKYILILDSDLSGLNEKNISDSVDCVLNGECDVTIPMLKTSFGIYKFLGVDFVCSQRVFEKTFITSEKTERLPGYGITLMMNKKIMNNKMRIKIIDWSNVHNPRKSDKTGIIKGTYLDLKATFHAFKTVGFFEVIRQLLFLSRYKV